MAAYRLVGSLATASQLMSEMLAETCRISKRLSRTTYRPVVRSASLAARLRVRRSYTYTLHSGAITARTTDARAARGAKTYIQRMCVAPPLASENHQARSAWETRPRGGPVEPSKRYAKCRGGS